MSKYRARPPINKKNMSSSGWAAAVEMFSRMNGSVPTLLESDLIDMFGHSGKGGFLARNSDFAEFMRSKGCFTWKRSGRLHLPTDIEDKLQTSHVVLLHTPIRTTPFDLGTKYKSWLIYGIDNWIIYVDADKGELAKMHLSNFDSIENFMIHVP